jgi:uncharacterized membrane protein YfcA
MDITAWLIVSGAVLIGSYVQTIAGFAMGMIVMAVGGASGAVSLPVLTAVVSLISAVNIGFALKGHTRSIDRGLFLSMASGQLPAIALGVFLITVLDRDAAWMLQILLGAFITIGSLTMIIKPVALQQVSPRWACVSAGFGGGLFGGLFAASGPVIGWFLYRQPLELTVVRATLLSAFALSTVTRTAIVGVQGGLTATVLWLSLIALPLVALGTWLGRIAAPPVSDAVLKRAVFFLLFLMGIYIIATALA